MGREIEPAIRIVDVGSLFQEPPRIVLFVDTGLEIPCPYLLLHNGGICALRVCDMQTYSY